MLGISAAMRAGARYDGPVCPPRSAVLVVIAWWAAAACASRPAEPRSRDAGSAEPARAGAAHAPPVEASRAQTAASPVRAEATTPAKTSTATANARRRFVHALNEGRAAVRSGGGPRAVEAFERALAMRPVDPVALCEAGWAQFQAGNLDRASDQLGKGVRGLEASAGTGEPRALAACLYNLGRVAEQRGQHADAIAHYRRSLALRTSDPVRARLASVEAASPATAPAPAATPRPTVFADLEGAVRDGTPEAHPASDDAPYDVGGFVVTRTLGPVGPVEQLVLVSLHSGGDQSCSFAGLYARAAAGWLVVDGYLGNWCEVDRGTGSDGFELGALDLNESADGKALVVLTFETAGHGTGDLLARPDPRREYAHTVSRFLVFEVTARVVDHTVALVAAAHVNSWRTDRQCEDRPWPPPRTRERRRTG